MQPLHFAFFRSFFFLNLGNALLFDLPSFFCVACIYVHSTAGSLSEAVHSGRFPQRSEAFVPRHRPLEAGRELLHCPCGAAAHGRGGPEG